MQCCNVCKIDDEAVTNSAGLDQTDLIFTVCFDSKYHLLWLFKTITVLSLMLLLITILLDLFYLYFHLYDCYPFVFL